MLSLFNMKETVNLEHAEIGAAFPSPMRVSMKTHKWDDDGIQRYIGRYLPRYLTYVVPSHASVISALSPTGEISLTSATNKQY